MLLANIGPNSAMSPKIVNGSYAALFDSNDVVADFSKRLQDLKKDNNNSSKSNRSGTENGTDRGEHAKNLYPSELKKFVASNIA